MNSLLLNGLSRKQSQLRNRNITWAAGTLIILCIMATLPTVAFAGSAQKRGEYLTTILGCGGCHTQGALLGDPTGEWLAGSTIGVAYTDDNVDQNPGIIFPANLTPDKNTGIGRWSRREIVRFLRTGMDHYGKQANPVMPWPNYSLLHDRDLKDIAAYLMSMKPVSKQIPEPIEPGNHIDQPFVRIGVYLFVPEASEDEPETSEATGEQQ